MGFEGIGASLRRKEDHRFLAGRGRYTDDMNRPGQLHAIIRRSDRAARPAARHRYRGRARRTRNRSPSTPAPIWRRMAWVACHAGGKSPPRTARQWPSHRHPVLAVGKVRHVGDPVAVIVARTRQQAKDAAELLDISYEDLPGVSAVLDAVAPGAPLVHDGVGSNQWLRLAYRRQSRRRCRVLRRSPCRQAGTDQ